MRIHRHADEGEMNEVRCGGEEVKWGEGGERVGRGKEGNTTDGTRK